MTTVPEKICTDHDDDNQPLTVTCATVTKCMCPRFCRELYADTLSFLRSLMPNAPILFNIDDNSSYQQHSSSFHHHHHHPYPPAYSFPYPYSSAIDHNPSINRNHVVRNEERNQLTSSKEIEPLRLAHSRNENANEIRIEQWKGKSSSSPSPPRKQLHQSLKEEQQRKQPPQPRQQPMSKNQIRKQRKAMAALEKAQAEAKQSSSSSPRHEYPLPKTVPLSPLGKLEISPPLATPPAPPGSPEPDDEYDDDEFELSTPSTNTTATSTTVPTSSSMKRKSRRGFRGGRARRRKTIQPSNTNTNTNSNSRHSYSTMASDVEDDHNNNSNSNRMKYVPISQRGGLCGGYPPLSTARDDTVFHDDLRQLTRDVERQCDILDSVARKTRTDDMNSMSNFQPYRIIEEDDDIDDILAKRPINNPTQNEFHHVGNTNDCERPTSSNVNRVVDNPQKSTMFPDEVHGERKSGKDGSINQSQFISYQQQYEEHQNDLPLGQLRF